MKNNPLMQVVSESFDRKFVVDKNGKKIFFPWGDKKQGYFIKSQNLVTKIKKFQSTSLIVCFIAFIITVTIYDTFWVTIGSMIICFGGWQLVYNLYVSRIVKSLPLANKDYKEVILEKISPEDNDEDVTQQEIKFPAHWRSPSPQNKKEASSIIKRIWNRLSPGQLFTLYFLLGLSIGLIWSGFVTFEFKKLSFDYLVAAIIFFLWGMSGYVMTTNLESTQKDIAGFIKMEITHDIYDGVFLGFSNMAFI